MASFLLHKGALAGGLTCHRNQINGARVCAPTNGTCTRLHAKAGNWLPGSDTPSYLEDVPGSFGFDRWLLGCSVDGFKKLLHRKLKLEYALGLARNPELLQRFQESELVHSRWAMLGVAGALGVELLGQGSWAQASDWVLDGKNPSYVGIELPFDIGTLLVVEFVAIGGAEIFRNMEQDPERRKYPGGAFDPLGYGNKDKKTLDSYKLKELKNGRLAMLAFLGFISQHSLYNKSPLQDLARHLENPWVYNYSTNGVSIPFLPTA